MLRERVASEEDPLLTSGTPPRNERTPLRSVLTRDVIIASANYSFLALVNLSFRTIQLLFLSTPIALGGLGLDPPIIGTIMSFYGLLHGLFVVFFFSRLTDRLGVRGVYLVGVAVAVPCFSLFPIINFLARNSVQHGGGLGAGVWVAVGLQVLGGAVICLPYGTSTFKEVRQSIDFFPSLQARCSSSSPPLLHPTRPLWEPQMASLKCLRLSCARSDPPW